MNRATRSLPYDVFSLQHHARGFERCARWAVEARREATRAAKEGNALGRDLYRGEARDWAKLARDYYRDGMAAAALLDR